MLIPDQEAVRGEKNLLHMMLLDVLREYTDETHCMTKEALRKKVLELYGVSIARNTLYDKLNTLQTAGFPIEQNGKGICLFREGLSDGELRFLTDSVRDSGFVTREGAEDTAEALAVYGSPEFREQFARKQRPHARSTRKNPRKDVFGAIEAVQNAIFRKRQISCNYLSCRADLQTEPVYPENIVINPYELVFRGGRYYLLGALRGSDSILSWRVERLCNVQVLPENREEPPQADGTGVCADAKEETFRIRCDKTAMDEITDVFGQDLRSEPEADEETVILTVRAERERMKAWAFSHTESAVVLAPEDFRAEMRSALREASRLYVATENPAEIGIMTARSFAEAVRLARLHSRKMVSYRGHGRGEKETADLSLLADLTDLTGLMLTDCRLENAEILRIFPMLRRLRLERCECPADALDPLSAVSEFRTDSEEYLTRFAGSSALRRLTLSGSGIRSLEAVAQFPELEWLRLYRLEKLRDISALCRGKDLRELELTGCSALTDLSPLADLRGLRTLRIDAPQFTAEDGIRLHGKTGVTVFLRHMEALSADTLHRLGLDAHEQACILQRGQGTAE